MSRRTLADIYKATDRDPLLNEVLKALENEPIAKVSRKTGIAPTTLRNWWKGKTRRPQAITMNFALRSVGKKFMIGDR